MILYNDNSNKDVYFARCKNAACSKADTSLLESDGLVGLYPSIVYKKATDQMLAVYFVSFVNALRAYYCAGNGCP